MDDIRFEEQPAVSLSNRLAAQDRKLEAIYRSYPVPLGRDS
ncbi:MAG: hypothetical protein Q7S84_03175 [bacterium]|nr:hypothetical protein [bacterium]